MSAVRRFVAWKLLSVGNRVSLLADKLCSDVPVRMWNRSPVAEVYLAGVEAGKRRSAAGE